MTNEVRRLTFYRQRICLRTRQRETDKTKGRNTKESYTAFVRTKRISLEGNVDSEHFRRDNFLFIGVGKRIRIWPPRRAGLCTSRRSVYVSSSPTAPFARELFPKNAEGREATCTRASQSDRHATRQLDWRARSKVVLCTKPARRAGIVARS